MEPFAIMITPREGNRFWDVVAVTPELEEEVRTDLSNLGVEPSRVEVSVGSCGYNAEASTIVAVVLGLLLLGREVDATLDAWIGLASKLRKVLQTLRRKHGQVNVSESAAVLLTLEVGGRLADPGGARRPRMSAPRREARRSSSVAC